MNKRDGQAQPKVQWFHVFLSCHYKIVKLFVGDASNLNQPREYEIIDYAYKKIVALMSMKSFIYDSSK